MCGTWFGRSGKGKSSSRLCGTKKWPPLFCETTIWPSVRIRGRKLQTRKLKPQERFHHLLLEWSSPRNKSKNKCKSTTEVLSRKFNWKKIQPRIMRKRTLKKTQIQRTLKLFDKTQKKRKYSNSKNFVSRTLFQIIFPQIGLKICNTSTFLSLSFLFLSYKNPFKNLYYLCYLFELISELESCGTYCLNLLFKFTAWITAWPYR